MILRRMVELGLTRQQDLVRPGLSGSTVSRLIYSDDIKPDTGTLTLLAEVLKLDANELVLFVHGSGESSAAVLDSVRPLHIRAAELDQMLADGSPLSVAERQFLDDMVNQLMDPYRKKMRRKRPA
jgi:hypothetical protein